MKKNGISGKQLSTSMRSPRSITNLADILSSISEYQSEEAQLSNSLSDLLSARDPILASLARLQALVPHLNQLQNEATLLSATVSSTAQTAERVGGRVRSLDEEMRRVREAGDRVGQVMELKVCFQRCLTLPRFPISWFEDLASSSPILH